jgi:hypothetical protein
VAPERAGRFGVVHAIQAAPERGQSSRKAIRRSIYDASLDGPFQWRSETTPELAIVIASHPKNGMVLQAEEDHLRAAWSALFPFSAHNPRACSS